jgi:hypothetical protein
MFSVASAYNLLQRVYQRTKEHKLKVVISILENATPNGKNAIITLFEYRVINSCKSG